MTSRRNHILLLISTCGVLAACADSLTAPAARARPTARTTVAELQQCTFSDAPLEGSTTYDQATYQSLCIDGSPPYMAPDRSMFGDAGALETEVDARVEASTEQLAASEMNQGYRSLRAYLDNGESTEEGAALASSTDEPGSSEATAAEVDGVTRNDFPVGDGILSILNDRGEIQVGDTVYKLTRDNVFAVQVADLAVLREKVPTLSSPAPNDGDTRITSQPVTTTDTLESGPLLSLAPSPDARTSEIIGVHTNNCWAVDGNYRMHGKAYITNALFYSEAGVRTEWERRKRIFGWTIGWSNTWQPGTLEVGYYSGNLKKGRNYVYPTSGSTSGTGTSGVHITVTHGVFVSIHGTLTGLHTSSLGYCESRVSA